MANTIIFLGAGASKADGAPLQSELFTAYVKSLDRLPSSDFHDRYHKIKRNILSLGPADKEVRKNNFIGSPAGRI